MNRNYLIILIGGVLAGCNSGGSDNVSSYSASNTTNNTLPNSKFETYLSNSYQIKPSSIRKMCDNDSVACEMIGSEAVITINYDSLTAIASPCFLQNESPSKKLVWNIAESYISLEVAMAFHATEGCIIDLYTRNNDQAYISSNGRVQYFNSVLNVSESSLKNGSNTEYTFTSLVTIDSSFIEKDSFHKLITGDETIHEDYSQSLGLEAFVDSYVVSLVNTSHHYDSNVVDIDMDLSNYFWFPEYAPIIELIEKTWQ